MMKKLKCEGCGRIVERDDNVIKVNICGWNCRGHKKKVSK